MILPDYRPSLLKRTCQVVFLGATCLGGFALYRHRVTLRLLKSRVDSLGQSGQRMQIADLDHGILLTNVAKADLSEGKLRGFRHEDGDLVFDQEARLIPGKGSMFEFPDTLDLYAKYQPNGIFQRPSYQVRAIGHPELVARATEDKSRAELERDLVRCFVTCCLSAPVGFFF